MGDIHCTSCHKGHEQSKVYCNECHSFDLKIPFNDAKKKRSLGCKMGSGKNSASYR
ncbi:MAG: cytochrome c3 family protein [Shewanella fodinae]|nr:cytochrome c3 family protein [Shewanella fodinae]